MAADKAQKSDLQVVGEESKEVEDVTEIVDTGTFVESYISNEEGYGVTDIYSFAIMKNPRLDDFENNKQADKNDVEDL